VRDKGRALKWIQFTTVGIDIALKAGLPEGVWVTNSGDVSQRVLAGHAMALMLGVMRGFRRFEPLRAQRDYARQVLPRYMMAPDGARMVILGMGRIGQDIARKAKAFDMEVICVTRSPVPAVPEIDCVVPREKVDEVLPIADIVMVAMPLDAGTQGFLSAERIGLMKETAVFVNISRGKVVDEAALARALADGRILWGGARRVRPRTVARGESAVGSPQRANDAPCWRKRRARTVAANERARARQHAPLSCGGAAQARRQNTRWDSPRVWKFVGNSSR
jgi:phosphoglycerate dehydrogenase-like enzyme